MQQQRGDTNRLVIMWFRFGQIYREGEAEATAQRASLVETAAALTTTLFF
jgi:hypothetical protein